MNSVEILFLQFFMHVIYSLICCLRVLLDSSGNPLQFFRLWEISIFKSLLKFYIIIISGKSFTQEVLFIPLEFLP